jgi:transmembrane sensor
MDYLFAEAAAWVARLQSPDCSDSDRASFAAWQEKSPAHAQTFARAQALFDMTGQRGSTDKALQERLQQIPQARLVSGRSTPPLPASTQPASPVAETPRASTPRRSKPGSSGWSMPSYYAAMLALGIMLAGFSLFNRGEQFVLETVRGEVREFELPDGSIVKLDSQTVIHGNFKTRTRSLQLLQGRALFDVAHDTQRPFSVQAGADTVTALGTVFQVALTQEGTVVDLSSGSVAVERHDNALTSLKETLQPGERLYAPALDNADWHIESVDTQMVTSWTAGRHVFRDLPLAEVLAEVNKYGSHKIRLANLELSHARISGNFSSADSSSIARAVAATLDLRILEIGEELVLFSNLTTH